MRSFRNKLVASMLAVVSALGIALAPSALIGQSVRAGGFQVVPFKATYITNTVVAADTEPAAYIKYVGSAAATTTVAVEADGNLTFVENGAAYDGFECPVSGALGGIIDVSNAACDTFGEVVDIVNKDVHGRFKMVLGTALRSDSSNAVLLADAADTEVKDPSGEVLKWDSSSTDDVNIGLWDYSLGIRNFLPADARKLPANANRDTESVLLYAHVRVTNAGTIGNYEVHCAVDNYVDGGTSSETDTVLYLEPGAATTALGLINEFTAVGGLHCQSGRLFVRALASGADTSAFEAFAHGYRSPLQR